MLSILSFVFFLAYGATAPMQERFSRQELDSFEVLSRSGTIRVHPCGGIGVIQYVENNLPLHCKVSIIRRGRMLRVEVRDNSWLKQLPCEVHFDVCLPSDLPVRLENHQGDIQVRGHQAPISFRAGSGKVSVERSPGPVNGRFGGGFVILSDVQVAKLKSCVGTAKVIFSSIPSKGAIEMQTGLGDLEVQSAVKPQFADISSLPGKIILRAVSSSTSEFSIQYSGMGHIRYAPGSSD